LASEFLCIAVDLPPEGFRDLTALAASLEDIRIEHKIDKWHVVGHDGGCAVAVHYAHSFQGCVERLALLSPSMFPELKPFRLFDGALDQPAVMERRDAIGAKGKS
jgi:pimeloyl-ACP methyl ester carboxylesterase